MQGLCQTIVERTRAKRLRVSAHCLACWQAHKVHRFCSWRHAAACPEASMQRRTFLLVSTFTVSAFSRVTTPQQFRALDAEVPKWAG